MFTINGPSMCFICGKYSKEPITQKHLTDHFMKHEFPTKTKMLIYVLLFKVRFFIDITLDKIDKVLNRD